MTDTHPDLASRALGGSVVAANDEFFAERENLINAGAPRFRPHTFGAKGQVYDGWETRRRRESGHDHAIVRLGVPGVLRSVIVDTAFFTGNYPPFASVEGCGLEGYPSPAELADAAWETVVPRAPLAGDAANSFVVTAPQRFTHVRLSIYPDGGVARLRVHGEPVPDPRLLAGGAFDLAALEHGGRVVDCSNMHYSRPDNLLMPGFAQVMGEGWETARRRDDGNDWVRVRLAAPGTIRLVELDTSHFRGNAPGAASLRGLSADGSGGAGFEILPRTRLQPDTRHRFLIPPAATGQARPADEVRLDVYPDGGMARLRLYGSPTADGMDALWLRWFNLLPDAHAQQVVEATGAPAAIVADRPLTDPAAVPGRAG